VFSPNGAYVLDVDPVREVNTVYAAGDRTKPLWSFPEHLWLQSVLLSDDGETVVVLKSEFIKAESIKAADGVMLIKRDGEFRRYGVAELCPYPRRTVDVGIGPVGDFWRTWYSDVSNDGKVTAMNPVRFGCCSDWRTQSLKSS
jgi:hypothetical protein